MTTPLAAKAPPGGATAALHRQILPETVVERSCNRLCIGTLMVMLVVIGADILTRSLFNFSFEVSDEIGGYMLVAISFLSLSVCQINGTFHHVEFVQARLSERGRAASQVLFDALSLAFAVLLAWQLVRFEIGSWRSADKAPTYLETPLWIPRLVLVLGAAALAFAVLRTLIANGRRLIALGRKAGPSHGR